MMGRATRNRDQIRMMAARLDESFARLGPLSAKRLPPAQCAALTAQIQAFLSDLRRSWTPYYRESTASRLDLRRTLHHLVSQPHLPPKLFHRERERRRKLVVVFDLSESAGFFAAKYTVLGAVIKSLAPDAAVLGFTDRLISLDEAAAGGLTTMEVALKRIRSRSMASPGRHQISVFELERLLRWLGPWIASTHGIYCLVLTDFVVAPNEQPPTKLEWLRRQLALFERTWLLDIFPKQLLGPAEWSATEARVDLETLRLMSCDKREEKERDLAWRLAESTETRRLRLDEYRGADDRTPVLEARRAAGWLIDELGAAVHPVVSREAESARVVYLPPSHHLVSGIADIFIEIDGGATKLGTADGDEGP